MGKGSEDSSSAAQCSLYKWSEIKQHNTKTDLWIVIDGFVYDITKFQKRHPGGSKVINFYSGQDATEAFTAFHKDEEKTRKYMNMYRIGKLDEFDCSVLSGEKTKNGIRKDFEEIRKLAIEMGLFKPSVVFFLLHAFHIVLLNILGYYVLNKFGTSSFWTVLLAFMCHTVVQAQSGWTQHDYGHLSVFKKSKLNHYFHLFFVGFIKGASGNWWNHLHNQHHAKPNVIGKDPDVRIDPILVLGEVQPIKAAERNFKNKKTLVFPYGHQHKYFYLVAPLLFPVFFQMLTFKHAITRRLYLDLAVMSSMYVVFFALTIPPLGVLGAIMYFMCVRIADSTWFAWVAQSNHVVMDVHEENDTDTWLELQLKATCNVEQSYFNDWFTGHLDLQIEHQYEAANSLFNKSFLNILQHSSLFPTMPRHNYVKIQPMIKSLCKKHGINYIEKPLFKAFSDIICSLEKSAKIWQEAYDELIQGM